MNTTSRNASMRNLRWVAIASIVLCVVSIPAAAQFRGCAADDFRCLDDLLSRFCSNPEVTDATVASCRALAEDLNTQQGIAPTTAIGTTLGGSYYSLALRADGDAMKAYYLESARQALLDVIAADDTSPQAYSWLALVDSDSIENRIEWLRELVVVDPAFLNIRSFVRAHAMLADPEAYSQAIGVARAAYDRAPPGRDKWLLADLLLGYYEFAVVNDSESVEPGPADEFAARVREDSNWNSVSQAIADPAGDPAAMRDALETACQLIPVVGEEPCMLGVATTVQAAIRYPDNPDAQILADAAAFGAMATPSGGDIISPDTRRPRQTAWLDQLLSNRLDSLIVLHAIATITPDLNRRFELRREIVARNPNSGRARLYLAEQLFNRKEWEPARVEFELASELLPPDDEFTWLVREYLRAVDYQIRNGN